MKSSGSLDGRATRGQKTTHKVEWRPVIHESDDIGGGKTADTSGSGTSLSKKLWGKFARKKSD